MATMAALVTLILEADLDAVVDGSPRVRCRCLFPATCLSYLELVCVNGMATLVALVPTCIVVA